MKRRMPFARMEFDHQRPAVELHLIWLLGRVLIDGMVEGVMGGPNHERATASQNFFRWILHVGNEFARALLGARQGEVVEIEGAKGSESFCVVEIRFPE